MKKNKVHIIHHSHWDMEWYFTRNETDALLNFNLKHILEKLENNKNETFLFDGQTSPFENYLNNETTKNRMLKLIKEKRFKIGPWFSQPDMRLTTDEGLLRNYKYGSKWAGVNTDHYNYIYNPDSFGFSENIPLIYTHLNKKMVILWRGVNRKAINNEPIFEWKTNNKKIIVYNMASGYFVGRYLYDDETLENLYKNNILPALKYQSKNDKYSVVAIPSGGDQQPYNNKLKNAIKLLNKKNDGWEYVLSDWNTFLKELKPQIKKIPTYSGPLTFAYGGRLHKTIGSHRPDIKEQIFKNELKTSRVLEPLFMLSKMGQKYFPKSQLDKLWKNVILSQAHDSYAGCNTDRVNKEIYNRLKISENIYNANQDMIIRMLSQNERENTLSIFNPTIFSGDTLFTAKIATLKKEFKILNKQVNIPYIIREQKKIDGGKEVIYTAKGEKEYQKPNYYVTKISFINNVKQIHIKRLKIAEGKTSNQVHSNFNHIFKNNQFLFKSENKETNLDLIFSLDAGDSYDLDMYDEVKSYSLEDAKLINKTKISGNELEYVFEIKLPESLEQWKQERKVKKITFKIKVLETIRSDISLQFENVPKNLVCQLKLTKLYESNKHEVATHGGLVYRNNSFDLTKCEPKKMREVFSNFDIMHGYIKGKVFDFLSLNIREYLINKTGDLILNIFRTPELLGRDNLRIRLGRKSGLSDKKVYTPEAAKVISKVIFKFSLKNPKNQYYHYVEELIIGKLTRHNQKLNKYINKTENWTLPNFKKDNDFDKTLSIDSKLVLLAYFKEGDYNILRLNNPSQKEVKTKIKINNKEKDVKFYGNEIKEWRFK